LQNAIAQRCQCMRHAIYFGDATEPA
jgi:hypothetical protein